MATESAFAALREALDHRHRDASAAAFTLGDDAVLRTGIDDLDRILGGGFPRGTIATLEGAPSSGRSAIAARLLAVATARGLGAMVGSDLFPPALEAAGVRLERLMCVPVTDPVGTARAADILLRSGAFSVIVVPAIPSGRSTGSAMWTRLASLAHRANVLLVALGVEASSELRYFASVRLETAIENVRWNGASGHLCELAGYDIRATVRKHKRSAPGASTLITCNPFEDRPKLVAVRERTLVVTAATQRERVSSIG
jgi:hypothetical protein